MAYRHRFDASLGNLGRGLLATIVVAWLLFFASPHPYVAGVLGFLLAAFTLFLGVQLYKLHTRIEVDQDSLRYVGLSSRKVRWSELKAVRLDFYTTRRDRDSGWMRLRLVDQNGTKIDIDSTLSDFSGLVGRALSAADQLNLPLTESTRTNVQALNGQKS